MTPINHISEDDINAFRAVPHPDGYQKIAIKSSIYPGKQTVFGLAYCALKLNGEAGELAEHIGKSWRDDGVLDIGEYGKYDAYLIYTRGLTPERKEYLIKELGDCLWYIAAICTELGLSMYQVMLQNLWKIHGRQTKNTQRGSGDDR